MMLCYVQSVLSTCSLSHSPKIENLAKLGGNSITFPERVLMGNDLASLVELQSELGQIGCSAYQFEQAYPNPELQWREFWQRLDWIDSEIQRLLQVVDQLNYLQDRIERHLDFGESLEDLI